jgi:hypothetical protein
VEQFHADVKAPARRGEYYEDDADDEESDEEEDFYPEDGAVTEKPSKTPTPNKDFFKSDIEG